MILKDDKDRLLLLSVLLDFGMLLTCILCERMYLCKRNKLYVSKLNSSVTSIHKRLDAKLGCICFKQTHVVLACNHGGGPPAQSIYC